MGGGAVYAPSQILRKNFDGKVVIPGNKYCAEMLLQLFDSGVTEQQIVNIGTVHEQMLKRQYFDLPQVRFTNDECFADVGACDGWTSINFITRCDGFRHIYMFEPDEVNLQKINKWLNGHALSAKITIMPYGVWNKKGSMQFYQNGNGGSHLEAAYNRTTLNYDKSISVVALDDELADEKVTFIKMDIEGSEYEALLGAKNIISDQQPKLAISVYHHPKDILVLPEIVLQYNPNYTFYLRHYALAMSETVLYAIP